MEENNNQAGPVITLVADLVKKPTCKDITGQTFGRLTAIRIHHKHGTQYKWLCKCSCGGERICFAHSLKRGDSKSCGCLTQVENLVGKVFTRWTVLRKDESRNTAHWICRCACGHESTVTHQNLKTETSRSCGCLERELASARATTHGHSGSKSGTYRAWAAMHTRCRNPNQKQWKDYGGRGITICERWEKFENFLEDMGEKPRGLTLGRIGNNGNYEPGNCQWETHGDQNNNRRNNRRLEFNGRTMNIVQWERETGIHHMIIHHRLKKGYSVERALTEPVKHKPKRKKV